MNRPKFENITSGADFNTWYWLKEELVEICKRSHLPSGGSKFELRDRIMYALDNNGKSKPGKKKIKPISKFNWAKEKLTKETVITDNVSFGPNFRKFMKSQLGSTFSCHSDFMSWVKENIGKILGDAIIAWEALEKRKKDPGFRREIADHNMFNQYIRDFLDDNKGSTFQTAKKFWDIKKLQPAKNGRVVYEKSDLELLDKKI